LGCHAPRCAADGNDGSSISLVGLLAGLADRGAGHLVLGRSFMDVRLAPALPVMAEIIRHEAADQATEGVLHPIGPTAAGNGRPEFIGAAAVGPGFDLLQAGRGQQQRHRCRRAGPPKCSKRGVWYGSETRSHQAYWNTPLNG
jgi:hypothetical protein